MYEIREIEKAVEKTKKTHDRLLLAVKIVLFAAVAVLMATYLALSYQDIVTKLGLRSTDIGRILSAVVYYVLFIGVPLVLLFIKKVYDKAKIYIIVFIIVSLPILLLSHYISRNDISTVKYDDYLMNGTIFEEEVKEIMPSKEMLKNAQILDYKLDISETTEFIYLMSVYPKNEYEKVCEKYEAEIKAEESYEFFKLGEQIYHCYYLDANRMYIYCTDEDSRVILNMVYRDEFLPVKQEAKSYINSKIRYLW